jgi:hypothetical protein
MEQGSGKRYILNLIGPEYKCFGTSNYFVYNSVADPDPRVFGPPGSGSTSQRYGSGSCSGSGSFYHHAKIVRKTLIPPIL